MFGTDNFTFEDRLSENSELEDSFGQEDKVNCSTPIKLKDRRSYSLIDVSNFDDELHNRKKLTISTDTIGSGSQGSVCKDSGYVHSESNTSLNSTKEQKRLTELIEDLKFKDVLITELQESNHFLRLKYAEAENRIAELRLKCETHCDCCNLKASNEQTNKSNDLMLAFSHKTTESCFPDATKLFYSTPEPKLESSQNKSSDDSIIKVKRWQETICSLSTTSSENAFSGGGVIANSLSTQTKANPVAYSPTVQTSIIGDRNVRVSSVTNALRKTNLETDRPTNGRHNIVRSPVNDVALMFENLHNLIIRDGDLQALSENENLDKRSSFYNFDFSTKNNEDDIDDRERLTTVGCTEMDVPFKRENGGKINRGRFVDHQLEMERTIRESLSSIAEKGKLEGSMRFRPWETTHLHCNPLNNKTGNFEFKL